MKVLFSLAALALVFCLVESKTSPPKVQVYTKQPGEFGKENTLICHVSGFHPPDITIRIMKKTGEKDVQEMPNGMQTDLAFDDTWHFHLTKSVTFTPERDEKYSCEVTHHQTPARDYAWEPNM